MKDCQRVVRVTHQFVSRFLMGSSWGCVVVPTAVTCLLACPHHPHTCLPPCHSIVFFLQHEARIPHGDHYAPISFCHLVCVCCACECFYVWFHWVSSLPSETLLPGKGKRISTFFSRHFTSRMMHCLQHAGKDVMYTPAHMLYKSFKREWVTTFWKYHSKSRL